MKLYNLLTNQAKLKGLAGKGEDVLMYAELSPKECGEIVENFTPGWQRKRNPRAITTLKTTHELGQLDGRAASLDIALVKEKNCDVPGPNKNDIRVFLLNTQHMLSGVSLTTKPITIKTNLMVCKSEREAEEIYSKIDTNRTRNVGDKARCLKVTDRFGLNTAQAKQFVSAAKYINTLYKHMGSRGFFATNMPMKEVCMAFYEKEIHDFHSIIESYGVNVKDIKDRLSKGEFLSVILPILKDAHDQAELFLHLLLSGKEEGPTINTLLKWLKSDDSRPSGSYHNRQQRKLIIGWNAYVEDKDITQLKVKDPNCDVDIKNTRFLRDVTSLYSSENPPVDKIQDFADYFFDPNWAE